MVAVFAQLSRDLVAIESRHHDIQEYQVVIIRRGRSGTVPCLAVMLYVDRVAFIFKAFFYGLGDAVFIFDDE